MTAAGTFSGNPFPGLRSFESDEEHLFFGREEQVDQLLSLLRQRRFIAVIGGSGSGKSSLVRAGLLPALHGGFMSGAGSHWYVAVTRPGHTPIAALASALDASGVLGRATGDPVLRVGLIQAVLERGALGLVEVVGEARLDRDKGLLVLVDQFEELFRFKAVDAVSFVRLLIAAASQSTYPIYVVITMRSDFLGDASLFRQLPEMMSESLFLVPRLTRAQFKRAIEGPIRVAGGRITARLTNRLLNDLEDDADQLPVLQHALMRTWDARADRTSVGESLDIRDLEAIGALSEALSRHGDEVYASLRSDRLREVAARVFKCLTDRGEDNRGVRRPASFADVCAIIDAQPSEVREVADAFRAPRCSFITPPMAAPIDDDTVLDISHESLMRIWRRLHEWVEVEALSALTYRRVASAALLYREGKAALWRDPDLEIAEGWRSHERPTAAWGNRIARGFRPAMDFLDASLAARARERRERAVRSRTSLAVLAVVAVALSGLSAVAFSQWRIADGSLRVERAERLADVSLQGSAQEVRSALLAADAYGMVKTPRTTGAMLDVLLRLHALRGAAIPSVAGEAFFQRGRRLAVVTRPGAGAAAQLILLDALSLALITRVPLAGITDTPLMCGSPDAGWVALYNGRTIVLYAVSSHGAPSRTGAWETVGVTAMSCLSGGRAVVIADAAGLRVLDFDTAARRTLSLHPLNVASIVSSPVGRYVAVVLSNSNGARIDLFDIRLREPVATTPVHGSCSAPGGCSRIAFSPDGRELAWIGGSSLWIADAPFLSHVAARRCECANAVAIAYPPDGSAPRPLDAPPGSAPIYDADTGIVVTHDDRAVIERAIDGSVAPALGMQKAPAWPGSFATIGSDLVLAGTHSIHVYDLDSYRSQLRTASDASGDVRLSDPGDGVTAVALNYRSGAVRIMHVGRTVSIRDAFNAGAVPLSDGAFTDRPEIAYDPSTRTVIEASLDGISRYAATGRAVSQTSWSEFAAKAGLPGWMPDLPYDLTSRGSYVMLRPPMSDVPGEAVSGAAVVSTEGDLIARFQSISFLSAEDAIGLSAADEDTSLGLYQLPGAKRVLDLPESEVAALAPNTKTIAYAVGTQATATGVALFDTATSSTIGSPLPAPPHAQAVENIAFSDDSRYLIVTYRIEADRDELFVYVVDPAEWQRMLCLWAGSQPHESERINAGYGIMPPDACEKYAGQILSSQSPAPALR